MKKIFVLFLMLLLTGCGGSSGSGGAQTTSLSGSVLFPSSGGASKVAAAVATAPTLDILDLNGNKVVDTVTLTLVSGNTYSYAASLPSGNDYVLSATNGSNLVVRALLDKAALVGTSATKGDVNCITTTALIVIEKNLALPPGTIGTTNATAIQVQSVSSAMALRTVLPAAIANIITAAMTACEDPTATKTLLQTQLASLANIVEAAVIGRIDPAAFVAGTTPGGTTVTATTYSGADTTTGSVNSNAAGTIATAVGINIPTVTPESEQNSSLAIKAVAKAIYDALDNQEDLTPYMSSVMAAFDVPTLGDADIAVADSRLSRGLPLFTSTEAKRLAEAFKQNHLVSVNSFESSLGEQGIKLKYYGYVETMSPGMLSMIMMPYSFESDSLVWKNDQVLPAFVLALGRERAKRSNNPVYDPAWSDGYLDPLQFTLLQYSIMTSGTASSAATSKKALTTRKIVASAVEDVMSFAGKRIRGKVTSEIGKSLEVPMGAKDGAQVSLCASLLLYGHQLTVNTTPPLIYYIGAGTPNLTTVTAQLIFKDDYYKEDYVGGDASLDRRLLETLGNCTFPRKGPVPGKEIEWSVSDSLDQHGEYDVRGEQTNADGESTATWRAKDNNIGQGCTPTNMRRGVFGVATAKVKGLVPGWSTVESIVGYIRGTDTGKTGESRLEVLYYDPSDLSCPSSGHAY